MRQLAIAGLMMMGSLAAQDFPQAEITNGLVTAKFYLPDAERGYYRATRFDWSGQIYSLTAQGNEYFGKWFERYDPKLHDAIMGPVDEFGTDDSSLGYKEAKQGEAFVRIGVGAATKPDDSPYQRFRTYDIVDPGKWKIDRRKDLIRFTHELGDHNGYAYVYTKTVRLVMGRPEMVIEHSLKNTGKKPIPSWQYNHNFFVINGRPTGPGVSVKFPFELKATRPFQGGLAETRGNEIVYLKELEARQSAAANFEGSNAPGAYNITLEHGPAGAGVRVKGDQPISKIVFWSIRTTVCPEAYVDLNVAPGAETKWSYTYSFNALKK